MRNVNVTQDPSLSYPISQCKHLFREIFEKLNQPYINKVLYVDIDMVKIYSIL